MPLLTQWRDGERTREGEAGGTARKINYIINGGRARECQERGTKWNSLLMMLILSAHLGGNLSAVEAVFGKVLPTHLLNLKRWTQIISESYTFYIKYPSFEILQ